MEFIAVTRSSPEPLVYITERTLHLSLQHPKGIKWWSMTKNSNQVWAVFGVKVLCPCTPFTQEWARMFCKTVYWRSTGRAFTYFWRAEAIVRFMLLFICNAWQLDFQFFRKDVYIMTVSNLFSRGWNKFAVLCILSAYVVTTALVPLPVTRTNIYMLWLSSLFWHFSLSQPPWRSSIQNLSAWLKLCWEGGGRNWELVLF